MESDAAPHSVALLRPSGSATVLAMDCFTNALKVKVTVDKILSKRVLTGDSAGALVRKLLYQSVLTMGVISTLLTMCCSDGDRFPSEAVNRGAISMALKMFREDVGRYPANEEGLAVLYYNPGIVGWRGPYYDESARAILSSYRYVLEADGQFTLQISQPARKPSGD